MNASNIHYRRAVFVLFAGLLLASFFSLLFSQASFASTDAYRRVNNQTIKYTSTPTSSGETVVTRYYHADKPQGSSGDPANEDTYFWRVKTTDNNSQFCQDYIVNNSRDSYFQRSSIPRVNGACAQDPTIVNLTTNYVDSGKDIFFYKAKTDGVIRPADQTASDSEFIKVPPVNSLALSAQQAIYIQTKPAVQCPRLLVAYSDNRWGFTAPKPTDQAQSGSAYDYYFKILTAYGYDTSNVGGCKVSDNNDVRANNEKALSDILGGSESFWKTGSYGDWFSFVGLKGVSKPLGNIVGTESAAEIRLGTTPAGSLDNTSVGNADSTGTTTEKTSCAIDGIGWIVCPVINFMAKIADGAFGFLATNFLETKPAMLDTSSTTYKVWLKVRDIANVLFVLAFMLIIFSQMTSIGINNYGIKRMLPRLIIAAILVNVSYFVCQLAVDVSNILGYSIKNIFEGIGAASNNLAPSQISANQGATGEGFAGIAGSILAITAGGALIYLMIGTLAPVLIAAIVALVMILFILVARQALVVMLVIISPLAFVAYLLPNTEQWFKKWQKTFIAMLMLFPVVATVFGASSLAAFIITSTFGSGIAGDSSNFFGQIIGAAVGILPLFVVPGLLKKSLDGAGSLVAKVAGKASSLGGSPSQKFSKAVGESRIGQFKRFREGEGVRKRNLIQAGAYRGRNPVTGLASKLNKGLNARTGKFGERSAATGVTEIHKAENEEIENEMKMQEHNSSPTTMREDTVKNFEDAVKSGNTVKARASQRILATQLGAPGVEALHESLLGLTAENGGGNTGTLTELQRDINSLGLKGKDVTLSTYGYTGGKLSDIENYNKTIRTTDNNGNDTGPKDPFSGLTSVELAGQSAKQLRDAVKAGFLTAGQATSVLGNANATQGMSQEKIAIFEGLKTPQQPGPEPTIVTANDHNWQSRL